MVAARTEAAGAGTAGGKERAACASGSPPRARRPRSHLAHDDQHLGQTERIGGRDAVKARNELEPVAVVAHALGMARQTPSANSATFRSPIDDAAANPCAAKSTTDADRSGPTQLRRPVPTASAPGGTSISPVIALLGSRGALLALGVVGPAALATAWPALRALGRRMARRNADIELLHQVALQRPLPQSTIEELPASLERVVFAPGATVFEEGEAGESFYIVAAVHAEVTRRGGHVDQLGPGSYSARPSCCAATCRAPRRCEQPTTPSFMSACWPASA